MGRWKIRWFNLSAQERWGFFVIAWRKRGRVRDIERGGAEGDGNGVLHSPSAALSWRF